MSGLPDFFSEGELRFKPRSYYFNRQNGTEHLAWAAGGGLHFKSGKIADLASVGLSYYSTQKLHGPNNRGNTGVLDPEQNAINTLGQAYLQLGEEETFGSSPTWNSMSRQVM
jgi:hypothetical protein